MTRLAHLIAQEEGFYVPGSLPNRNHNPGDLRHSPHSFHTADKPDAIGQIATDVDGWADLERQLELYAKRNYTLRELVYEYAPPSENNSGEYLAYICKGLGCPADTFVYDALKITGDKV